MANFKRVVNVIPLTSVSLARTQIYTYLVPLALQDSLGPGMLVRIPFRTREISGLVSSVEMHRLPSETRSLKNLLSLEIPGAVMSQQSLAVANWVASYYVAPLGLVIKAMLPKFEPRPKDPQLVGYEKSNPDFILTDHQRQAVSAISGCLGRQAEFMLFGVTGSGKTEVYMQVMEQLLPAGKQVIILVPEISLTAPAVERFARRFGMENIALLGSHLKDSERLWMWREIREKRKSIIIGPRSSVFAPVSDLGLVIIDEEHDPSFKQYDQQPKYHAREVARKLSELWNCPLVLGDATPSVSSFYFHQNRILELPHRIMADVGLPKVKVVDMRRELAAKNFSIFSEALKSEIVLKLKSGKQIILFLNRRGMATFVMCRDCGFTVSCQRCDLPLVYHLSESKLICHHCGRKYSVPEICPSCGGARIKYFGIGTETVDEELKKFLNAEFPDKPLPLIARLDRDTAADRDAHQEIYKDWASGKTRILIGTQMISKGWDVSRVGLVGIVSADTTLFFADFRSSERTFQILTQVAGRAGRGSDPGIVVLQTYHPDNFAIQAAKAHDYKGFFGREVELRKKYGYPPFSRFVKLTFEAGSQDSAHALAKTAVQQLRQTANAGLETIGPIPAFVFKLRGRYRYQVMIRASSGAAVDFYTLLEKMPAGTDIDVDPESLL